MVIKERTTKVKALIAQLVRYSSGCTVKRWVSRKARESHWRAWRIGRMAFNDLDQFKVLCEVSDKSLDGMDGRSGLHFMHHLEHSQHHKHIRHSRESHPYIRDLLPFQRVQRMFSTVEFLIVLPVPTISHLRQTEI